MSMVSDALARLWAIRKDFDSQCSGSPDAIYRMNAGTSAAVYYLILSSHMLIGELAERHNVPTFHTGSAYPNQTSDRR
jgi:hypothetical protein